MKSSMGVNYPYRSQSPCAVGTVLHQATPKSSYHVEGMVNNAEVTFLIDTGAEVSLLSSQTPGLVVKRSQASPVSINNQPIGICGEAEVIVNLGTVETKWKFLVVDNLLENVLGADFIEGNHSSSWGIHENAFWLDARRIPLVTSRNAQRCNRVKAEKYSPVVARCTVELPARHQVIIPMKTKSKDSRSGLFESTRTPGGVLMTKTLVYTKENGGFWVKAVNLSSSPVTLFKNQKVGRLVDVETFSEQPDADSPIVAQIKGEGTALKDLGIDLSQTQLNDSQREELENLLLSFSGVFSKSKQDIGRCNLGVKHHIHLKPGAVPVKQPSRRIPFTYRDEVKRDLKEMLEDGIIERSTSEWASPLVIVRKPSGDLRICVDYRRLNVEVTMVTSYPLPNLAETLDRLTGAMFFTTLDMVSGYHQIEVETEDRAKTAFTTTFGLFQFCRMPFGLAGAPGTFQSVIEDMVNVLDAEDLMAYLDDLICFHSDFPRHLKGIERVLTMVRNAGFKLSGKKCQFATKTVKFLGHIINQDGIRPQPEKLEIIQNWPTPQNEAELRQFLGVCSFWRKFVKDFSKIAVPLHNLLNKAEFVWSRECDEAFVKLKNVLCLSVTLKLPDRYGRFSVTCDASDYAVGYYLEQADHRGQKRPVAFGGRKLNKAECNYSTTEKECLAVMESLKAYRPYLLGSEFDLYTDHQALKWLLTRTQEHSGRLWRWIDKFREFQCKVHHIAGNKNTVADALSRIRGVKSEYQWSLDLIKTEQEKCPHIKSVMSWLISGAPSVKNVTDKDLKAFHKELANFALGSDGLLMHTRDKETWQIVIPRSLVSKVLGMNHDDLGHFGYLKTWHRIENKYYWPFMSTEIQEWCNNCWACQQRRNPVPANKAPLQPLVTTRPGELVTMDIVEYPKSSRGSQYCLVMVDHFTKWLELFPMRNMTAETIAKKVFDFWIPRHGAPEQLHNDQGRNLTAEMINEVCKYLEIWHTRTTPFHPQSDGATERSIRTVNNMLAKMVNEDQRNWDLYISSCCLAYNTAVHSSTDFTPSFLEFGRELRLPNDLVESSQIPDDQVNHAEYASRLKSRLNKSFEVAKEVLASSHKTQKDFYDRWAKANAYKEGDLVLWRDKKVYETQ